MDQDFFAWFVYLVGAIGYLVADAFAMFEFSISDVASNSLFTSLAVLFLLNSIQYLLLWFQESKRRPDVELWAELINILASLMYLVSAFLFFLYPIDTQSEHPCCVSLS